MNLCTMTALNGPRYALLFDFILQRSTYSILNILVYICISYLTVKLFTTYFTHLGVRKLQDGPSGLSGHPSASYCAKRSMFKSLTHSDSQIVVMCVGVHCGRFIYSFKVILDAYSWCGSCLKKSLRLWFSLSGQVMVYMSICKDNVFPHFCVLYTTPFSL